VPMRNTVVIPFVRAAFDAEGEPVNPEMDIRLQVMLDDLAWWSSALEKARAAGELAPARTGPGPPWPPPRPDDNQRRRCYNIAAHPDQVQIEVEGRKVAVAAEQLHGAERAEAWQQIVNAAPRFAGYQQKTDRELPIIRLVPRSGPEAPRG
jgi:hypothetical protein